MDQPPSSNKDHFDICANVPLMLVTANVGTLFEDPERLMHSWLKEFFNEVLKIQPKLIALHLQEVGGKSYEVATGHVRKFCANLSDTFEMNNFSYNWILIDENFNSAENFTALGSLYFVHKSLVDLKIWNFQSNSWEIIEAKNIFIGNIESVATKEKLKFPRHYFPESKWSRKGFMRTRWNINNSVIDLVNVHLFHDASNLSACEAFPSVYCETRRKALVYILERLYSDKENGFAPFFIFGDFNFRCDTEGVIKELTRNLIPYRIESLKSGNGKIYYKNSDGDDILSIGKKEFYHVDHQVKFKELWLKDFDKELEALNDVLFEFPIEFEPTYPYEENPDLPSDFMNTRCPAWCDRILMSFTAKSIISDGDYIYNIIGKNVCMGDHKPIYLNFRLKSNQGTMTAPKHCTESLKRIVDMISVGFSEQNTNQLAMKSRYICIRKLNSTDRDYATDITPDVEKNSSVEKVNANSEIGCILKETVI